ADVFLRSAVRLDRGSTVHGSASGGRGLVRTLDADQGRTGECRLRDWNERSVPEPSRRDFVTSSALGLIGIASGAMHLERSGASQPDGELLYVGTYTESDRPEGIYLVRMDTR